MQPLSIHHACWFKLLFQELNLISTSRVEIRIWRKSNFFFSFCYLCENLLYWQRRLNLDIGHLIWYSDMMYLNPVDERFLRMFLCGCVSAWIRAIRKRSSHPKSVYHPTFLGSSWKNLYSLTMSQPFACSEPTEGTQKVITTSAVLIILKLGKL